MIRKGIRRTISWLRRAVSQPLEELNRWQLAARFAYDLGRYGARQLQEDRAPQMAAALAFRTLFGLAPVLIVATILVKAIKGSKAVLTSLHDLLVAAGLDKVRVIPPSEVASETVDTVTLAKWLENLMGQLTNMNLSTISWVGLAVIIYAAIGLMVTIENSFNIIYRAPDGRPWTRRIPLYWFILTLSPMLVTLAAYGNKQFDIWVASVDTWPLLFTARVLWSVGVVWLFMFAVYMLVPNLTVAWRPALIGALVAAVLLEVGMRTLGVYLGRAFSINQLYGSLGLVPLFMFWVYLMWLAVLFGLQVSATLQMLHGRAIEEIDHTHARPGMVDPTAVLTVMEVVAENFVAGQPLTSRQIAEITSISEPVISQIVERLIHDGWLHRIERPEVAVSLAKPPGQMRADEFIEIGFQLVDEPGHGRRSVLCDSLREAQKNMAGASTLATLLSTKPAITSGDS